MHKSDGLGDRIHKLQETIQSYQKISTGKPIQFSEKEKKFEEVRKSTWSFLRGTPSLLSEVEKANLFINREIQEITDRMEKESRVSEDLQNTNNLIKKVLDELEILKFKDKSKENALNKLRDHLREEIISLQNVMKGKQKIEVNFEDLKEIELPLDIELDEYMKDLEEQVKNLDPFEIEKLTTEGSKSVIFEPIETQDEIEESAISIGSFVMIDSESASSAKTVEKEIIEGKFEAELKQLKQLKDDDFRKILDYVKKNKSDLFQRTRGGITHLRRPKFYWRSEKTGLPAAIQIEIPKDKKAHPDEMLILIHLKPETAMIVDKTTGRRKNVIHLGTGAFKEVRLSAGFTVKEPFPQYYATATLKAGKEKEASLAKFKEVIDEATREMQFLQRYKGKRGIVQLEGHCLYPPKSKGPDALKEKSWTDKAWERVFGGKMKMNMVMTYAESDLQKDLNSDKLSNSKLRHKKILDMMHGLVTIHEDNVIHFDIKPENILTTENSAMLADFGLSEEIKDPRGLKGSFFYMAPEIFTALLDSTKINLVDQKADVYSMGCILFMISKNGNHPLETLLLPLYNSRRFDLIPKTVKNWHTQQTKLLNDEIGSGPLTPEQKEMQITLGMMDPNPSSRLSSEQALLAFQELYHMS